MLDTKRTPRSGLRMAISAATVAAGALCCVGTEAGGEQGMKAGTGSAERTLDGKADDWVGTSPLWQEVGLPGRPGGSHDLDIGRVWLDSDAESLLLFIETRPSVAERFAEHGFSGWLGDLLLDLDLDPSTGAPAEGGDESEAFQGYELRARINLVQMSRSGESTPEVSYDVVRAEDGTFPASGAVASARSFSSGDPIAHGPEGIELAVPLAPLGITAPHQVRLLLTEEAHRLEHGHAVATVEIGG